MVADDRAAPTGPTDAPSEPPPPPRPPRPSRRAPRWLPFLPSLGLGVFAAVGWLWRPPPIALLAGPGAPTWLQALAGLATAAALLAASEGLERTVPSFRFASRMLERGLRPLRLRRLDAVVLAVGTSLAEEVAFRGVLLGWFGLVPQAVVFGLLHPATWRGWSYTLFTAVVGLALGALTLAFGGLLAALVAHAAVNGFSLWQVTRGRQSR